MRGLATEWHLGVASGRAWQNWTVTGIDFSASVWSFRKWLSLPLGPGPSALTVT